MRFLAVVSVLIGLILSACNDTGDKGRYQLHEDQSIIWVIDTKTGMVKLVAIGVQRQQFGIPFEKMTPTPPNP